MSANRNDTNRNDTSPSNGRLGDASQSNGRLGTASQSNGRLGDAITELLAVDWAKKASRSELRRTLHVESTKPPLTRNFKLIGLITEELFHRNDPLELGHPSDVIVTPPHDQELQVLRRSFARIFRALTFMLILQWVSLVLMIAIVFKLFK